MDYTDEIMQLNRPADFEQFFYKIGNGKFSRSEVKRDVSKLFLAVRRLAKDEAKANDIAVMQAVDYYFKTLLGEKS